MKLKKIYIEFFKPGTRSAGFAFLQHLKDPGTLKDKLLI